MEKKTIIVKEINIQTTLDKYYLFEWKLEGQKDLSHGNKEFTFIRDDSVPCYQELKKLEEQYPNFNYPSMLYTIILSAMAFIIVTGLLILLLVNKDLAKKFWYLFLIPSAICLLITVFLTYKRIDVMKKIQSDKPKIDHRYKEMVEALKK